MTPLDYACTGDQPNLGYYEFSTTDPHLVLGPGARAAQSFRPSMNLLCMLSLEIWFDAADLGRRFVYNVSIRESLDGPPVAASHVDLVASYQQPDNWYPYVHLTPEADYYITVEVSDASTPLSWYWMNRPYDRGAAYEWDGTSWNETPGQDFLFSTSGFDDPSAYPLPDPSWTAEEWQSHNWKTYPIVATWLDLNGDGKGDVYSFNNSYTNGTPVTTNGTVDPQALDPDRMLPVNLSIAFEYTSALNTSDGRAVLKILVNRLPGGPQNAPDTGPAWIMLDGVELLPLLFSPPGTKLDLLNLTWNSTLEQNAFNVYFKEGGSSGTQVWIYIGHFSTQTITVRGPAPASSPPSNPQVRPAASQIWLWLLAGTISGAIVAAAAIVLLRQRSQTR